MCVAHALVLASCLVTANGVASSIAHGTRSEVVCRENATGSVRMLDNSTGALLRVPPATAMHRSPECQLHDVGLWFENALSTH